MKNKARKSVPSVSLMDTIDDFSVKVCIE